jgi:hypothetical protein
MSGKRARNRPGDPKKSQRHPTTFLNFLSSQFQICGSSSLVSQWTTADHPPRTGILLYGTAVTCTAMKSPRSASFNLWVSRKRSLALVRLAFGILVVYSILANLLSSSQTLEQREAKGYRNDSCSSYKHAEPEIVETDSMFVSDSVSSSSLASPPFAIFYNIYIPPDTVTGDQGQAVRNALRIVQEQMTQVGESYAATSALRNNQTLTVYYNTIGHATALNATYMSHVCSKASKNNSLRCQHMQHYDQAYEEVTLERVQEYCHRHESHKAIYMHSKGSYHSYGGKNEGWRRHMTMAVTDERCITTNLPSNNNNHTEDTCNVCGLMFFVMPAFMFRGNFWTADCSYVNQLVPAVGFEDRLRKIQNTAKQLQNQSQLLMNLQADINDNFGLGRYAAEHWIGSHPSFRPCDLTHTVELKHWFQGWKSKDFNWSMAPIAPLKAKWSYQPRKMVHRVRKNEALSRREYFLLPGRILRWYALYNDVPPPSSWVWSWFPDGQVWREAVEKYGIKALDIMTKDFATNSSRAEA